MQHVASIMRVRVAVVACEYISAFTVNFEVVLFHMPVILSVFVMDKSWLKTFGYFIRGFPSFPAFCTTLSCHGLRAQLAVSLIDRRCRKALHSVDACSSKGQERGQAWRGG